MARYRYYTADVFTDTPFGGNQLAVFPDARNIPERRLQDVAREFNFSETTFVYPAETQEGTRRVRIFTPGAELPFAGHPTIGTAHVLAAIGELVSSTSELRIVLDEPVGPVPVTITLREGRPVFAQLSVAKLPELGPPAPGREALAHVLGLELDDFLPDPWIPQGYSCGLPFLFVPVRNRAAVARAQLRLDAWERTLKGTWHVALARGAGIRDGTAQHSRCRGGPPQRNGDGGAGGRQLGARLRRHDGDRLSPTPGLQRRADGRDEARP